MRKLFCAIITVTIMLFATMTLAQQAVDQGQQQPPKTLNELQWQARALQQEAAYINERLKTIQVEFNQVQSQIKALQPAPPAKATKPKDAKQDKPENPPEAQAPR